tara:strand:- start:3537 stop:4349 length:813 start_codon:yes stop_codon:yes gene_type:complete
MKIHLLKTLFSKTLFLGIFFGIGISSNAKAHEPIFGIGPRTIWMHGFGFETSLNIQRYTRRALYELDYEVLYGVTSNWAVTLSAPQSLNEGNGLSFGNIGISTKYRFYKNDVHGGVYHAAILGGVEFQSGDNNVSTNTTDYMAGLSGAYEGRRWLMFATGRYRLNTNSNNLTRGDVFLYDLAAGFRPVKTGYYKPDVVFMAELNGQIFGRNTRNGTVLPDSKGSRLAVGVGAWITYRNWAFKPGIQVPIYDQVGRDNSTPQLTFAVEFHL